MSDGKPLGTTLKTVERALDVLEIVSGSKTPLTVREISDQLDHNLSSTYHIINTLLARRYLTRNEKGGLLIGESVATLNASLLRTTDFDAESRKLIRELARDSGETVYLTKYVDGAVVIQFVVESQHSLRVKGLDVGYSGAEDRRASGKAVLAHLDDEELARVVSRLHGVAAPSRAEIHRFEQELQRIRDVGYAFDNEDYELGVCCIAVPFYDSRGKVVGSVAASAPAQRVDRLSTEIREQVSHTAEKISRALGSIQPTPH